MSHAAFRPGFRVSAIDVAVLVVGGIAAAVAWPTVWWAGFVIAFILSQFFLFCNVFRVARKPELIWSALFLTIAAATIVTGIPGWPLTIAVLLLATLAIVAREMRKPCYHGIGWRRINPGLEAWWAAHRNVKQPHD